MPIDVLLGLQWGDEGKGKVVDVFTPHYDIVARFQGGPNAGHTIIFNQKKYVLHLVPSGIFHEGTTCIVGNGVVIDPVTLRREIETLEASGEYIRDRIVISQRAHLILPTHKLLDAASEKAKGDQKIGSTLRGIGPTYMDKTGRNGLRIGDLLSPDFEQKYRALVEKHRGLLSHYDFEYDLAETEAQFLGSLDFIRSLKLDNTEHLLHRALREGKTVLAEGAQGTLLDIEFGSYPFVTSSNTIAAGACTGLGVPPGQIGRVFGIFKAYATRVGSGPFPTELDNEAGERLREAGGEYGATTGRPRRCGWIDLPLLKYSILLNGVTDLIMTKADVLSSVSEVKACTAYRLPSGEETTEVPYDLASAFEPVFRSFPGWEEDITGAREKEDLPRTLRNYIEALEAYLEVPVSFVSVGPDREQILHMREALRVR